MPFQRRGSCIFHWRRRAWLTIWDKVKSHGTVRLMHRKRVTCELHDSYFRSMTIKHAIPRTAEVTHPDGQLWEILSGRLNYYITRWRQEVRVLETRSWSEDVVEKALENEKDTTLMAIRVGVHMLQFCSVSNSLSHTNLSNKVRGIFF